ncbi:hypothetical protein CRE_22039 [Caenorhabditis remanei]|uniref:F-box domain-containing protein n=1 Tax=Caenorhabditis remanei TaxID=31234 RepID=E3N3I0_CAERE|nr:hypothetical protein CRE_22039 [Caenorhabditis remanei]
MSFLFPLLRLPGVVLFKVFKSLSIGEKIKLSFCSKKVSIQINIARFYSQKVVIDLDCLSYKIRVHSENTKDAFEIFNCSNSGTINNHMPQYRIEGRTVPVYSSIKGMITLWKNHRKGFLYVIRYLLKMFRCKFSINNDYNSDMYEKTISELFDLQVEFKKLTIDFEELKNQYLLWNQISTNLELVEDLRIFSVVNPDFTPVFTSWPQNINISSADWFTLEYLLACTCTTIQLWNAPLRNKDLDMILKNWQAGGFPNLKYLKFYSQRIKENESTILGMKLRELAGMVIRTDDGSKKPTINTGYCRILKLHVEMRIL